MSAAVIRRALEGTWDVPISDRGAVGEYNPRRDEIAIMPLEAGIDDRSGFGAFR